MIRVVLLGVVWILSGLGHGKTVSLDAFHGLQGDFMLQSAWVIDQQDTVLWRGVLQTDTLGDTHYHLQALGGAYRWHVGSSPHSGVFYSLGCLIGRMQMDHQGTVERDMAVIPYYDLGIITPLSPTWFHVMRMEVSYWMVHTDAFTNRELIGLRVAPYMGFGVQFD